MAIAYNVPSVSEVPKRGIWAKMRSTVARYALLGDPNGEAFCLAASLSIIPYRTQGVFFRFDATNR